MGHGVDSEYIVFAKAPSSEVFCTREMTGPIRGAIVPHCRQTDSTREAVLLCLFSFRISQHSAVRPQRLGTAGSHGTEGQSPCAAHSRDSTHTKPVRMCQRCSAFTVPLLIPHCHASQLLLRHIRPGLCVLSQMYAPACTRRLTQSGGTMAPDTTVPRLRWLVSEVALSHIAGKQIAHGRLSFCASFASGSHSTQRSNADFILKLRLLFSTWGATHSTVFLCGVCRSKKAVQVCFLLNRYKINIKGYGGLLSNMKRDCPFMGQSPKSLRYLKIIRRSGIPDKAFGDILDPLLLCLHPQFCPD